MTISFFQYLFLINYAPMIGIVFMFVYLLVNKSIDVWVKRRFSLFLALEAVELVAYSWELCTAQWAAPSNLRILLSAVGYSVRPMMAYIVLMLALRVRQRSKRALYYAIPLIINTAVSFSAFFCGIAYSYDASNKFVRGPLGFTTHIFTCAYLLWVAFATFSTASKKSHMESVIVAAGAIMCIIATIAETLLGVRSLGRTTIFVAVIFYFMYFQSNSFEWKMDKKSSENTRLKEKAETDPLTGLLNKNAFIERVSAALSEGDAHSGVLFFIDLDNFKNYNDTLGHLEGDVLLRRVAGNIKAVFRENDYVGRFGGDEFYAFMQDFPYDALSRKTEGLLKSLDIPSDDGRTDISASIGAAYTQGAASADDLLRLADIALYDAKRSGKNRFVIYSL